MSEEELLDTAEVKDAYVGARNEHYGEQTEYYEKCFDLWLESVKEKYYYRGVRDGSRSE